MKSSRESGKARFSIKCPTTKPKVITKGYHRERKQSVDPMKARSSKYL